MADNDFVAVFQEEARELLEELEGSLLELENSPEDIKLVGRVFRSMHTIKGSAAMFGLDRIADFTHHVETALDRVRDGAVPVCRELINLILQSRDFITALLDAASGGDEPDPLRGEAIIHELAAVSSGRTTPAAAPATETARLQESVSAPAAAPAPDPAANRHYLIDFQPQAAFFEGGGDPRQLLEDLQAMGQSTVLIRGAADPAGLPGPAWKILLSTVHDHNAVRDVFIFAESSSTLTITPLATDKDHRQLAAELAPGADLPPSPAQPSRPAPQAAASPAPAVETPTPAVRKNSPEPQVLKGVESIRVAADKLDTLINLVGELVVTQARLTDVASALHQASLLEPVEQIEHLTAELRDLVLNIRMLPIGSTFTRFKRLVRDLSAELGKEVEMKTVGEETELDKTVIEQLNDPLIHLIRNSIDHGIESPEERLATGKPRSGTLFLSAVHNGANVVITVLDDGKGLDADSIRRKALQKGIISDDAVLSEQEIFSLIFAAGVSTARRISSVSGRGVGMDVVKNAIEKLRGSVQVNSEKNRGTTVTITLPLTMAIIDGLLVRAGDTHFVLPLAEVEECVELTAAEIARYHGRRVFAVRGHLIPYVRLRDFFVMPGSRPDREQMVIVSLREEQLGLVLDEVVGGHQTVIKSLGWTYRNAEGLSGSTILGNGEVALIIDTQALARAARIEESADVRRQ
ncbi:MAG: chemotaxis protein CheA [Desulfurivibrio sp.]|nr:MAG: chemotaxis protein CheA [Desulfurivibrio sp.]